MIQEIAPHKFDNEYKARPPKDEDIVVLFEDNEILLKENQFFTYADLNEGLKKEINHFQYYLIVYQLRILLQCYNQEQR